MGKSTHFLGQPLYGQVIKLLDKAEILEISRKNGGERYIKRFDAWTHLMTMLYAVIMRHDSLREISVSMLSEARKLAHLGVSMMPTRSTLSDANARRPEVIVNIYRQLGNRTALQTNQTELPPTIFLWREQECHQNPDLGNAYRKPSSDGYTKSAE